MKVGLYIGTQFTPETHVPAALAEMLEQERKFGLTDLKVYLDYGEKIKKVKRDILTFLIKAKEEGKTIAACGAPAKGNTLLNYAGIRTDFIEYTVDRTPQKQGCYLPGTHIPIMPPEYIYETKPDYVVILLDWDGKVSQAYGAQKIERRPRLVLLDKTGAVSGVHQGEEIEQAALAMITDLLGPPPESQNPQPQAPAPQD